MKLVIGFAILGLMFSGAVSGAEQVPITEDQALAAIQGCWAAQSEGSASADACFRDGGVIETSVFWPADREGFGGQGKYNFTEKRLHLKTDSVWEGWLWQDTEVTCSVVFSSRKAFALYDCTGRAPDTLFKKASRQPN